MKSFKNVYKIVIALVLGFTLATATTVHCMTLPTKLGNLKSNLESLKKNLEALKGKLGELKNKLGKGVSEKKN